MHKILPLLLLGVFSILTNLQAEVREWTRASDGKKITAEYVGMKDEATVQIKMANGSQFEVPLSGLSAADREYVKGLKSMPAEGTAKATEVPEGETTVILSGVAIPCDETEKTILALASAPTTFVIDSGAGTVTINAPSGKAAKAAVDAISRAGYYGVSDNEAIRIADLKEEEFLSDTMRLRNVQLFCRKCIRELEKAVESVDGVKEVEAKVGARTIQVSGKQFDCNAVLKALREAGFNATYS